MHEKKMAPPLPALHFDDISACCAHPLLEPAVCIMAKVDA